MKKRFGWICGFGLLLAQSLVGQNVKSVLRGVVNDESGAPLKGAHILISSSDKTWECSTDSSGNFCSDSMGIGRVKVRVQLEGYSSLYFQEVEVKTGINSLFSVVLQEKVKTLKEVVIKGRESKDQPNNSMALIGARRLSMEEASRYAGGFDDPARLASSFGGAAGGIGNNGITVRGNKPGSFQWRMEGMEIPNPNHFADVVSFGAGGLSALSSQLISSADFYTGGFPSEYGNALSGIMDIKIRNGNATSRKYGFKLGAIGTEASSEGPFKKGGKATYNFHYRYSTLSLISFLLPPEAGGIKYQDLSMKLYFPTRKTGKFSVWYLGARDKSGQVAEKDSTLWKYDYLREQADSRQGFSVAGISNKLSLSKGFNLNTTLVWTANTIKHNVQRLNDNLEVNDYQRIYTTSGRYSMHAGIDRKFGPGHLNKTGVYYSVLYFDNSLLLNQNAQWDTIADGKGQTGFLQLYSQSRFTIRQKLQVVAGIHSAYVGISRQQTLEPRISAAYQVGEKSTLALSFGNHSQLERIQLYTIQNQEGELVNKSLKLSRAYHESMAWETRLSEKLRLKAEVYAQQLYDIPVVDSSSFSLINMTGDWFFRETLVNKGLGRNVGLDMTLERFMGNGFYYLLTGSLFDSRYKGGDGVWRETRYNRNWIGNFLIGKEWKSGKRKNNLFNVNMRFTCQGGEKITPVVYQNDVLIEQANSAFTRRLPTQPLLHLTLNYRINKARHASLWSLQVLNALSTPDIHGYVYNKKTQTIDYSKDILFIPNLSYKVEF